MNTPLLTRPCSSCNQNDMLQQPWCPAFMACSCGHTEFADNNYKDFSDGSSGRGYNPAQEPQTATPLFNQWDSSSRLYPFN